MSTLAPGPLLNLHMDDRYPVGKASAIMASAGVYYIFTYFVFYKEQYFYRLKIYIFFSLYNLI